MKIGPKPTIPAMNSTNRSQKQPAAADKAGGRPDRVSLSHTADVERIMEMVLNEGAHLQAASQVESVVSAEAVDEPLGRVAQGLIEDSEILSALLGGVEE